MQVTPLDAWASTRLELSGRPTVADVEAYQLARLRATLVHVMRNSRFYRSHLYGLDPASILTFNDIGRLPFTTPAMLAEDPSGFFCVSLAEVGRIVTLPTSGTTGPPKRIVFTAEDQELTVDFFHYGMTTLVDSSDRVIIFMPGRLEGSVGDLLAKALSRFGCECVIYGPISDYDDAFSVLVESRATCAVGIPSQLLALSRKIANGIEGDQIRLKSVLLSTDCASTAITEALRNTWGCDVYDHYGMTEMGLGGAVECSAFDGYHLREADLLFEIVDPETGARVPDGVHGEVVFSTLTRRGMPLIRYRTGDRSRFLTAPCPCGSALRRMERVSERIDDAVRLGEGISISMGELDEIVYRQPCVVAYGAELERENGCDRLVVTVEGTGSEGDRAAIARLLRRNHKIEMLQTRGRLSLDVRAGETGYFTKGTSKRRIIDRR